jgi:hypothetical protein
MPAAIFASRLRAVTRRERTHRQSNSFADRIMRDGVEAETVGRIEAVIEQLALAGARTTVDAAVFRDAIVVVLRADDRSNALDARQEQLLREHTTTWSTAGGKDGRTVCFEIARS